MDLIRERSCEKNQMHKATEGDFAGFNNRVYEIVRQIPEGKVATYGQIAFIAGVWRASRAVGYALHRNPYQGKVPCHRVVFKDGGLTTGFVFGGKDAQRQLLETEGVKFNTDGRVNMNQCRWNSPDRHRVERQNTCAVLLGELIPFSEYGQKEIDHPPKDK